MQFLTKEIPELKFDNANKKVNDKGKDVLKPLKNDNYENKTTEEEPITGRKLNMLKHCTMNIFGSKRGHYYFNHLIMDYLDYFCVVNK